MTQNQNSTYQFSLGHLIKDIDRIEVAIEELKGQWDVGEKTLFSLNLVLEEIISNTMFYGFGGRENGEISVAMEYANDHIDVLIKDNAIAFDPTVEIKESNLGSLDEREIGGLGIMLSQRLSKEMTYSREGDYNKLSFKIEVENANE